MPRRREICQRADVPLVLDATAALGPDRLLDAGGWSVLTGWAGAFGGPASVGILVIKKNARWRAPYPTDDYQGGRWPGVPDVPAIYAAAVALDCWLQSGRDRGRAPATSWSTSCAQESRSGYRMWMWPAIQYAGCRTC